MYATNHSKRSVKEIFCFHNQLFVKALSSLEKLIIHLLLHDSLYSDKKGYISLFLSNFLTYVLARFSFGPFSNTLVDSRKGKLSLGTSAGPWLMGLGLRSG